MIKRYTKPVFLATLAIATSLLLAGCGPRSAPLNRQDVQLNQYNQESQTNNGLATQQGIPQNEPNEQTQQQVIPTESTEMKQLSDFEQIDAQTVTITTSKGDIVIDLFRDKAPITTANFLDLVNQGFYEGIVFHRVIDDFMAQVGDPLTKDPSKEPVWGSGGPGYVIPDEFDESLSHDKAGIVSMANRGPNTGGSQFFITYEATPWLDGKHAVFGEVTQGMDVVESITVGDTIESISW